MYDADNDRATAALRCPACGAARSALKQTTDRLTCSCGVSFPVVDGVVDMAPPHQDYFFSLQSVSAEQFRALLGDIRSRGWETAYADYLRSYFARRSDRQGTRKRVRDFMLALRGRVVPGVVRAILCRSQAYYWLLTGLRPDGTVLDLGAGWSAISHVLAAECREVVAADVTLERLQFSALRAKSQESRNLRFVRTPTNLPLPFADASFDLVVINGVLEWVAASTQGRPEDVQRDYLREVHRILKADGQVIIGIENRYGFSDLMGFPEGHVGLPFVGVLPRRVGDIMSRALRRGPLRVATHSGRGLKDLLTKAGFADEHIAVFAPQPTYSWYDTLGGFDERASGLLKKATLADHPMLRKRTRRMPETVREQSAAIVGAFYAVAGKSPWRSVLEDLGDALRDAGLGLRYPMAALRVREHKVSGRAAVQGSGRFVHFAIGMSALGNQKVRREYEVLELLQRQAGVEAVETPKPLLQLDFRGHVVSVLEEAVGAPLEESGLESHAWSASASALSFVETLGDELPRIEKETAADVWRRRWGKLIPLIWDSERRQRAGELEALLRPRGAVGEQNAPFGHGDLLAGNILYDSRSNTIVVIDWEAAGNVYPGEDAVTLLASHARARYGSMGAALLNLLHPEHEGKPPAWSLPLTERILRPEVDYLRALVMAWLAHVSHGEGSYVHSDPGWLRGRVWGVLDALAALTPLVKNRYS